MKIALFFIAVMSFYTGGYFVGKAYEKPYETVQMNVSAYCPCELCCGDFADGITASGVVAEGLLVAAPSKYSFGTKMLIPGYSERPVSVQDRGGAIVGNKIDVFFGYDPNSSCTPHEKALQWGRQQLTVKIFKGENQ